MDLAQDVLDAQRKDVREMKTIILKMVENTEQLHKSLGEIKLLIKKLNYGEEEEKLDDTNAEADLAKVDFFIHEDKVIDVDKTLHNQLCFARSTPATLKLEENLNIIRAMFKRIKTSICAIWLNFIVAFYKDWDPSGYCNI